jgi:hypothetical protein
MFASTLDQHDTSCVARAAEESISPPEVHANDTYWYRQVPGDVSLALTITRQKQYGNTHRAASVHHWSVAATLYRATVTSVVPIMMRRRGACEEGLSQHRASAAGVR